MFTVNLGGTAIGTAINVFSGYLSNVVPTLAKITGFTTEAGRGFI